ncbi:multiple sugar transport system permease protein [Anaerocolumna jejuensis DSM 15929]|uniref:Multiple sugar transport system permease protein n=1 Tax=Anaerocolumna jejuensis DSM 15929 TaxID=1121322 RepID=A0A1M6ZAW3_9FIRM|nr:sugar ABC transporter permease [Anaerocolumna jejuensis]SHL27537.1 multiple sugar transport system permease protein [Anaerocolumna jejuensis DSM 15929]
MDLNTRKTKSLRRNEAFAGYMFILPCLFFLLFMAILPVFLTAFISLTNWGSVATEFSKISFVGLENYKDLFKDATFYTALKNNILLLFYTIPIQLLLSFILAVMINKYCYFKNFFKSVYFLPYISSTVAVATIWMVVLQPSYGPVTEMLKAIGIENTPKWLSDMHWALPSLSGMVVWQNLGYDIIIILAALQTVPVELYESADMDGANWFVKITKITLPMITPTIFFLIIYETMETFRIFDQISVLTDGGPGDATQVLVFYLYKQAFRNSHINYGAAITVVLFIIVFIITLIQWLGRKKWVHE